MASASAETWVALLRGINVGGAGRLPMKELVPVLRGLGLADVKTYLQSGNVVFRWPNGERDVLAARIGHEIRRRFGFEPTVLLKTLDELQAVVDANPFPEAEEAPATLHVYFLEVEPVEPDLEGLDSNRRDTERFVLGGRVFYLHAPEGIGRSKLAARMEKLLGAPATGRNWRSLVRILALAREVDAEG